MLEVSLNRDTVKIASKSKEEVTCWNARMNSLTHSSRHSFRHSLKEHVMADSVILDRLIPASEFSHGGAAKAFAKVQVGEPVIVMRRSVPAYVIITPDEYRDYEALREEREDAADLALAERRLSAWDGDYSKLPDVNEVFDSMGVSSEMADEAPEVEFE